MDTFGFKDLESVSLKATYNLEIGSRQIEAGETIVFFDKIQIAGLQEFKQHIDATGGFDNRALVTWDTTKQLNLNFSQGVFSKEQFSLMTNSKMITKTSATPIVASMREYLETDEEGKVTCKHAPEAHLYVYNASTGAKMTVTQSGTTITTSSTYTDIIVDYEYNYVGGGQVFEIGQRAITGFVSLEGKTRVKDDTTGQVVTGLIKIPKLRLMSDLSIRLGAQANPVVGNFSAVGVPVGSRGDSHVSEFYLLSDDIESDL